MNLILNRTLHSSSTEGHVIKKGELIYSEIVIHASSEKVWKIFTDFEKYPEWNPFIKSLKGSPAKGKAIEVFLQAPGNKGMLFKPKVLIYETGKEFRWLGKLMGGGIFDGEHTFLLKDNDDGTCTFVQYERFRGILIPFMKKMLKGSTLLGFRAMNEALKQRCENKIQIHV